MQNLKILNNFPVQNDFWGNGAVYHGYAGMPDCDGRVYSEELCELEAKRAADMRLKIARTFYGWWAWEPETKTWNWENERMRPFYKWLQRMKDANITVALNTGWCSPGDVDGTSWNKDCPFNVSDNGELTIVVVNNKAKADNFRIEFEENLSSVILNRHSFDPSKCIPDENADIIPIDSTVEVSDCIVDGIAPYGVIVYTTFCD